MIGICVNVNYPDLLFRFLKDVAMGTNFMAKFGYVRSFGRVAFENGLQYGIPIQKYSMEIY